MGLKKNIIYQFLYQVLILVVPLILSKYITNIIPKATLGIYSYTYSIASYFSIFAMLGIQKYGTRLISKAKKDENDLRTKFWSLSTLHIILSLIVTLFFVIFVGCFVKENKNIYWIQTILLASSIFDITWLFYGLENFKGVVLKNTFVKILEVTLILIFVKKEADLWIYTLIMALSVFVGQIVVIPSAIKQVKPIKFKLNDMLDHVKPMLILSISVISTSMYSILDKVILGALSPNGKSDVALYEYSDKVIKIPLAILAAIETVLLPRMSVLSNENNDEELKKKIYTSIILFSLVSIGATFGLASISDVFVGVWYGEDYKQCAEAILILSPVIFIISFGDIVRSQFLLPKGMDKQYTISVIVCALVNLTLNLILIPYFGLFGALIGTLSAEFSCTCLQFFMCRKDLPILKYILEPLPFILIGGIMLFINLVIKYYLGVSYISLFTLIIVGLLIYGVLSFLYLYIFKRDLLSLFKIKRKVK